MRSEKAAPQGTALSEDSAASVLFDVQRTAEPAQDTPTQLRRRRAASRRLEPMADGRRDPFEVDRRDRWTSTRTLHVECGRRTAWLYGGRAKHLIESAAQRSGAPIPSMWDHLRRLWIVPIDRADDILVYAEHVEGRFTTVEAVDR
ncbi:hypothetical protein GCM10010531_27840 [Blastococcus jejuensis]|uniref:Uncharacterized protein n=1 Tax=Blastococcus jejuensis TaxID=351224 RepID=A0ABP6PAH9_9ACTN